MEYIFGVLLTLISFFLYLYNHYFKKKTKIKKKLNVEVDLSQWNPKPLVDEIENESVMSRRNPSYIVDSVVGKYVHIGGEHFLNFSSHNYLSLIESQIVKERAKNAIYKYGVGSCGPRGFYGTVDVHLELEARLAKFMGTESCIVYSYGFTTIASAIAAYAKKNDAIFVDEKVNFAIQRGMEASRSQIYYFKHNDTIDLEKILKQYEADRVKNKKSESRKFLIVEGIYMNTGYICPLPELIRIRRRYKLRMFIDESISVGVLGTTGRGVVEHFNVDIEDVDMIMGSMEYALGSGGGFCVGSAFIVEHQRLAGSGYCFSASLPPFLAVAAYTAIDLIEENNFLLISALRERCRLLCSAFEDSSIIQKYFQLEGDVLSPVKHLKLKRSSISESKVDEWDILFDIAECCKTRGVIITVAHYLLDKEHFLPTPSIRLTICVSMEATDVSKLVHALEHSVENLQF